MTWSLSALLGIVVVCITARDVILRLREVTELERIEALEAEVALLASAVRDTSTKLVLSGKGRR
ncbi:hypothetical protein MK280_10225 [Myxococcota bacterium]|mgnify:CR=1 FL=1|nr:hypothetical protein [Myxococcota bacterium]